MEAYSKQYEFGPLSIGPPASPLSPLSPPSPLPGGRGERRVARSSIYSTVDV